MKAWMIAAVLTGPAFAGVIDLPLRPAGIAAPAVAAGAAKISFDGAGPLRPWLAVAGTPFVRMGSSLVDTRAPGAPELLKSATYADDRPVVGLFEIDTARVLNAYALGVSGVNGHSDALPQGRDPRELGGWTLFLRPDGRTVFMGSGSLPADVTPAVQRAILRHVGVRPAEPSLAERLRRLWYAALDWAAALGLD